MTTKLTDGDRAILRTIREKVEATHWAKQTYYATLPDGKERFCLTGLVNMEVLPKRLGDTATRAGFRSSSLAVEGLGLPTPTVRRRSRLLAALLDAASATFPRRRFAYSIEGFNDHRATRREDIIRVIDRALGEGE